MKQKIKIIPFLFNKVLSNETRSKTEKIILNIALLSFFVHLTTIYCLKLDLVSFSSKSDLLSFLSMKFTY